MDLEARFVRYCKNAENCLSLGGGCDGHTGDHGDPETRAERAQAWAMLAQATATAMNAKSLKVVISAQVPVLSLSSDRVAVVLNTVPA